MKENGSRFETNEVMKTLDVFSGVARVYRIEILHTTNPKEPYSANCYEDVSDGTGKRRWSRMDDFPWIGAMDLEGAVADALGFLEERLPDE